MEMTQARVFEIADASGPSEARRAGTALARDLGFDEQDIGRIALVITELGTNLVKHAKGGSLVLSARRNGRGSIFDAIAIDSGPGFDLDRCLRDGHSTAGSPGEGLGAIARLSNAFDAYSPRGGGSVVFAEVRDRRAAAAPPLPLLVAGVSIPKAGEEECGDAWTQAVSGDLSIVLVADGIGHGPDAAAAAREAVRAFEGSSEREPSAIVQRMHEALRPTRGATVGVAAVDTRASRVRYAGIGNIGASVVGAGPTRNLVSHNGTAGREVRKIQEFSYPWPDGATLVMASDGLATRWDLEAYPGLLARHPGVVAGVLYRDFSRGRDDVTVVVGRQPDATRVTR